MKKVSSTIIYLVLLFLLNSCAKKHYEIKNITGFLVEMNDSFDKNPNLKMLSFVQSYKDRLDAEMHEVIGEATINITKSGMQSVLANFTADAMHEYAENIWGTVDFAVINNGGHRSTYNKGSITVGNLYEIYAFENCLVLLELQGKAVKQLFDDFARNKMEGFSKNVHLTIKNNVIESFTIGGKPLDEEAIYRVVTVDYLAEGNDGMQALTQATQYSDSFIILRDAMIEYIKNLTADNKKIYAIPDDRIEFKE